MTQTDTRLEGITYRSEAGQYELDQRKIMRVVYDLFEFVNSANTDAATKKDKLGFIPSTSFYPSDRSLIILTDRVNQPGSLSRVRLAQLNLDDLQGYENLTLKIEGHSNLAIDPFDLHDIGRKYSVK